MDSIVGFLHNSKFDHFWIAYPIDEKGNQLYLMILKNIWKFIDTNNGSYFHVAMKKINLKPC